MPRGLSAIKQIAAEAQARQKAYDESGPGVRFFILDDQQTAIVRFLEQGEDVWYVWTHELPRQQGQRFGDAVMCLDQDDEGKACSACSRGIRRTARVCINVIWYDAPVFEREPGKDGKPGKIKKDSMNNVVFVRNSDGSIATAPCVAVWNASQTVGGRLEHLDTKARETEAGGLMGCIYEVKRSGTDKQTSYMIDLDKIALPTPEDRKLFESKGDPRTVIKQLSFGDMERAYSGGGIATSSAPQAGQGTPSGEPNAFADAATGGAVKRGAFG